MPSPAASSIGLPVVARDRRGDCGQYIRFLDYAAERVFLRKVGGGYIFTHRLLMEYFATLEPIEQTRQAR
jgi:hypothetical protein